VFFLLSFSYLDVANDEKPICSKNNLLQELVALRIESCMTTKSAVWKEHLELM